MLDPKSVTTGGNKYSFYIDKGSFNLFQRCYARGGRHDFITGSRVAGPNVWVDCAAVNTIEDIGPHHRYATGILFDNIYGGEMRVQNRKDYGSGQGWAGAQTMFWNCESHSENIKVESPIGAMNWGIGCVGLEQQGDGYWESWGTHVLPRSLYYQQLQDRLGENAVESVTIEQQRNGASIKDLLQSWAGIGELGSETAIDNKAQSGLFEFELYQNTPNPFSSRAQIEFSIDQNSKVTLEIFNILGEKIRTLVSEEKTPGLYSCQWDGVNHSGVPVSSGIYLCVLKSENRAICKKMILLQ